MTHVDRIQSIKSRKIDKTSDKAFTDYWIDTLIDIVLFFTYDIAALVISLIYQLGVDIVNIGKETGYLVRDATAYVTERSQLAKKVVIYVQERL